MDEPTQIVLTDTSTAYALSLQQRIVHPETTPEEKERLQAELSVLLSQWWENLKTTFVEWGQQLLALFKPLLDAFIEWGQRLWKRAYPKPRPLPPLRDKRAWQHAQKLRAQIKRQRREQARARTALAYQYRARHAS